MKRLITELQPYVKLYRDNNTGIAWVEDGTTGLGHSAHPNISASGSVKGMKTLGYWDKTDATVRSHGFIYNISKTVVTDELDKVAATYCQCAMCSHK